jgi:DNA-binding NtrC family response regulator
MASIDFRLPSHERPTLSSLAQRTDTFTLLVDRIDKATPAEQTALLSLYERREEGVLDARIIATSNIDIRREGAEGRFRKELVPHAAAVRILVPPLRARAEDIPLLVRQFAREVCGAELDFENHDFDRLLAREYPGNVRELRQLIGKALQVDAPPLQLPKSGLARARAALVMPLNARPKPPQRLVDRTGDVATAAKEAGLQKKDFLAELDRLKIAIEKKPEPPASASTPPPPKTRSKAKDSKEPKDEPVKKKSSKAIKATR